MKEDLGESTLLLGGFDNLGFRNRFLKKDLGDLHEANP
jgi:hypothetical protein